MLRILVLSCLVVQSFAASAIGDEALNNLVENIASANNVSKCDNIVGDGSGCYECYHCGEDRVERLLRRLKTNTVFQLFDSTCSTPTTVCCFSQAQNTYRSSRNCGTNNPEGKPRRVRNSLRAVLPGEYPWRAWIYSSNKGNVPLCAAVYVISDNQALLAPASCVYGYEIDDLRVSFTRDIDDSYTVKDVIPHKHFKKEIRYYDIALIGLSYSHTLPPWVKPVCLPEEKVNYGTSCITISSDDYYSNVVIPQQSNCAVDNIPLDENFLCTVSPINDYEPEFGGALICPEVASNQVHYTIYGVTLYKSTNSSFAVHANIAFFSNWINNVKKRIT